MQTKSGLFARHQYISLETFRKSGEGVRTPVWFAQDGSTLYVWTDKTSGKARRIRRNPRVMIAPSTASGKPLGEFISAQAQVFTAESPEFEHGNQLIDKKYGILKKFFEWMGRERKANRSVIRITLE